MEQLSLFDSEALPDINSITEEQAVALVGERIGVKFQYSDFYNLWRAKIGKMEIDMNYGHYSFGDKRLYVGVGFTYNEPNDYCGGSAPCDKLERAIDWLKDKIRRYNG